MGVVYEAEQESLGRRVALKVLAAHGLRHPRQLLRFHREARAAARLHHTNIVPVFGVGESEGQHYYVMQFIPGLGLDAVLDEIRRLRGPRPEGEAPAPAADDGAPSEAGMARSLMTGQSAAAPVQEESEERPAPGPATPAAPSSVVLPGQAGRSPAADSAGRYARSVALVGVQVAEALEYAHRQGTLHRDIKPSNLLLDGQGTIWVADFGLAKAADSDDLTHTGDIVGTVRYMAPERFEGRCDARSDVYALGLTLYELLALRPAFDGSDRAELIHRVTHEEPPRLRALDPTIPRDLRTVVHKAIEREPARRYADAAGLAEDLRRFIEGRPIRARRTSLLEHAWRWCRRNPAWAALTATGLVLVGVAAAWWAEAMARQGPARLAFEAALERAAEWSNQSRWSEAREVLALAEGLLKDAGARGREGRLREAQANLELAARLERNAIERMDFMRGKSQYPAVAAKYAAAFRGAGLAADEAADAEAVAARIRGSAIRDRLVAALDDWALVSADALLRARLLGIARRADPDPGWRDRVRDPAARGDRGALERLAAEVREATGAEQPPQLVISLAALLEEVQGDPAPLLRTVQRRRPEDFWLNRALGAVLVATRPAEAVGFMRAALVLRPRDAGATIDLGWALETGGAPGEALAAHRRAIALDPKSAWGHYGAGNALLSLGRPGEALADYRRAVELDPKLAAAQIGVGTALRRLGRPGEALAAYRRAIELDPKRAVAHNVLGRALVDLGRPGEALATYCRAIALDPDYHTAWDHAASLWARTGDRVGYRDHCRGMLDRFGRTTDPPTAERTAKACLLLPLDGPEQDAACDLADRAVAMAQGHWVRPWAEATRGLAAYRREQFADAVAWADRSLSRSPGTWNLELPAHLVRTLALARLGRRGEAGAARARASDLYRTKVAKPGGRAEGGDWHDQVICEVLRREAEALFLDRDFPADPFAR
jgi:tetratricopeptide (TPR) repeat protein